MNVVSEHVSHVFCLPGGFSQYLNDALNHHPKLKPVFCLHESGAAFAACGYAAYTGGLSVCLVTSGPGSTNALTGLVSAWQDSLPVLFISGDAKTDVLKMRDAYQLRQGGVQDVDIMRMVARFPKYHATLSAPSMTRMVLNNAVEFALKARRGPSWVSVPLDVQGMDLGRGQPGVRRVELGRLVI